MMSREKLVEIPLRKFKLVRNNSSPDDYDSDSSADDSDEVGSSDTESDHESIVNSPELHVDRIMLHNHIHHGSLHCPPFFDMTQTFAGIPCRICKCEDFNFHLFPRE